MGIWIARHRRALATTVALLREESSIALLTVLGIALTLALPLGLEWLLLGAAAGRTMHPSTAAVALYLKPAVPESRARQLAASIRALPAAAAVTVITSTQALQQLRARSGLATALDALADNPLPNALEVVPALPVGPGSSMTAQLDALRTALAALPEVDSLQVDADWAHRWDTTRALVQALMRLVALWAALAVLILVANTIRRAVQARRADIELAKLVGASNAFVCRPFLYLGACYGLAAALLAGGLAALAGRLLAAPAAALLIAYGIALQSGWPPWPPLVATLGAALGLGWLGALGAARLQVRRVDPLA